MTNPLITKKIIECVVLELGAVVTSYCHNEEVVLALHLGSKVNEYLLSLIFRLEKVDPSVS